MKPETLEYALHAWPDWHETIDNARENLGYTPGQSAQQIDKWQWDNYGKLWTRAEQVMKALRLPQSLKYYWICCFFADFRNSDGSVNFDTIYDVITGSKGEKRKIFPWLEPEVWYPAQAYQQELKIPDEYIHAMPFKIEGTMQLLDWDSLKEGIRQVSAISKLLKKRDIHPLTHHIMRAKELTKLIVRDRQARVTARFRSGEATFDDLLSEEWQSPQVQDELERLKKEYGIDFKYSGQENKLKKRVYNRIRNLLIRNGLSPGKPKTNWWESVK